MTTINPTNVDGSRNIGALNEDVLKQLNEHTWQMDKFGTMARIFEREGLWYVELQYKRAAWRTVRILETPNGHMFTETVPGIYDFFDKVQDSKGAELQLICWIPHRKVAGELRAGDPRKWTRKREREEREAYLLQVCREHIQDCGFVSEVIEMIDVRGQTVMWCTVPKALKERYNCTDMKCLDIWLERCGMDIKDFSPEMKLRMRVTSVSVRGKFFKTPIVRGIPDKEYLEQKAIEKEEVWLSDFVSELKQTVQITNDETADKQVSVSDGSAGNWLTSKMSRVPGSDSPPPLGLPSLTSTMGSTMSGMTDSMRSTMIDTMSSMTDTMGSMPPPVVKSMGSGLSAFSDSLTSTFSFNNEKEEKDWLNNFMSEMKHLEDRMSAALDTSQDAPKPVPIMGTLPPLIERHHSIASHLSEESADIDATI